jgi:hypothetical protein
LQSWSSCCPAGADIKGYPTLKLLHKGAEAKAYRGQRDLKNLKAFVDEAIAEYK